MLADSTLILHPGHSNAPKIRRYLHLPLYPNLYLLFGSPFGIIPGYIQGHGHMIAEC